MYTAHPHHIKSWRTEALSQFVSEKKIAQDIFIFILLQKSSPVESIGSQV